MKKLFKKLLYLLIIVIVVGIVLYAWPRLPIITGFAAKGMCSCVFIADREPNTVSNQDLSFFPISLAKAKVDYNDKSVTATLLGLAKRKAVYREGLGCALVVDYPEEEIRMQSLDILSFPRYNTDSIPWPKGDLLPDSLPAEVAYNKLEKVVAGAFDESGAEPFKKTFGVVVVYDNVLVAEKYAEGFDMYTECLGWSMAKSINNALVGILVKKGKLDISVSPGISEWENDERRTITLNNLLHMNSGLEWTENYFNLSDVTKMLYMRGDKYGYAIGRPLKYQPDSVFFYSSGTANIISGIIRHAIESDEQYHVFPYSELFSRTGMNNTILEADASGTYVGSSYCFATPRDWARFGLLFLNNGIFAGDTLLPEGWVEYTTTPATGSEGIYGAQFWLHDSKKMPDVPDDMFFCDGFKGQRVFIVPSSKLVVVRLGYSYANLDFNEFLRDIIGALPD